MKKLIIIFILLPLFSLSQNNWINKFGAEKSFIKNHGQFIIKKHNDFNNNVLFAYDGSNEDYYFTKSGVIYSFKKNKNKKVENNKKELEKKKTMSHAEWEKHEALERKNSIEKDIVFAQWLNTNKNLEIIPKEKTSYYHSYTFPKDGKIVNVNHIKSYKKLIYKNIYKNIDIEYEFHQQNGLKYNVILHPGSNISDVKLLYSRNINLEQNGNITIPTKFGNIIDHAPVTFYDEKNNKINSSYTIKNNIISFKIDDLDNTKTIIIDPWSQTPFTTSSNGAWECEYDAAGNAYVFGDGMLDFEKLKQYNSAGVLQWTYTSAWDTSNKWLGTLATDLNGNSYITAGSTAEIEKIDNTGNQVWSNTGGSMDEYWAIAFNCDQTKLIVGGTRLNSLLSPNGDGIIFDINTTNGNVLGQVVVGNSRSYSILGVTTNEVEEVRSITSSYNSKYYYLTLDTLGVISQNFSACPNAAPLFQINSGYAWGYKSENFRPDNGNGSNMAIKANDQFVYTLDGENIQKRSLATGAVITTATIPGGHITTSGGGLLGAPLVNSADNNGIDLDDCGNVYVGSINQVVKYDANLNQLATFPTSANYNVSDVAVSTGGNLIVCGTTGDSQSSNRIGYIESIDVSACSPTTMVCCDATICPPDTLCNNDPATNLISATSGGTWSGTGITNTTNGTFDPSVSGIGTFWITYTLSCGSDSVQVIVENCSSCTPPNLTINTNLDTCAGANVDLANQVISDGGGTLSYLDINANTLASSTVTTSGSYIIQSTDPSDPNCFDRDTIVITFHDPTPIITGSLTICNGNSTTLDAGSGYADYSWSTTDITQTITVNTAGTYSVTVTDNYGCTGDTSVTVNVASSLSPVITGNTSFCTGDSVNLDAGAGYATYSWSTTESTQTIWANTAGTYSVTVTDGGGCTGDTSITIVQNPNPQVTINGSLTFCTGNSTTLDAGSGYNTYLWNTGDNTQTITVNTAGTYIVTVTDVNNCHEDDTITVTQSSSLSPIITGNLTFCTGSSTTLDAGSGYDTYSWSTAATSQTITVNTAGTYSVTVTDAGGCTGDTSVTVTEAPPPTVTITGNTQICSGTPTNLDAGAGYTSYIWSNGNTTQLNTVNSGGTYSVTITDNNGCTANTSVLVTEDSVQTPTITGPTTICNGDQAVLNAGSGYDTYSWSTGDNTQSITVTNQGTYSVTVTNSNCSANTSINVNVSPAINLSTTSTDATCFGNNDGTANVTVTGGTSPLTFLWSTGDTTQSITGVYANYYQVTVTDAAGCSESTSVLVNQPNKVVVGTNSNQNICIGDTAYINAAATGGTAPYTYFWNTGQSNNQISVHPTQTTDYYVYAVDAGGCKSDSIKVNIFVYPPLSLDIYPDDYYVCKGDAFTILVNASGGNGHYTYTLDDGTIITPPYLYYTTQTIKESVQVTLTDNCGTPSVFDTLSVYILPLPEFTFQPDITSGCQPLTVQFSSYANNSSYDYYWNFGDINSNDNSSMDINPLHKYEDDGVYSVTLTAKTDSGCTNSLTVPDLITVYKKPISKFKADKNIASVVNPQINYYNLSSFASTYHWMFGDGDSSIIYSPSHMYPKNPDVWYDVTLIVKTEHNCADTSYDRIYIRDEYTFYAPTAFTPDGDGVNDYWFVLGHGISDNNFKLLVFDRWGEIIWEATSQYDKWDGTVKSGKEIAPVGEYTWKVYYLDNEELEHSKAGSFMLIR